MRFDLSFVKGLAAALVVYLIVWQWMVCRVYVPPGEMLVLIARMGTLNPDPENLRVVDRGFQGVQKIVLGEGRHFVDPVFYERVQSPAITIAADEIGVVRSKTGNPLPAEEFLVPHSDDIYARKGMWREVESMYLPWRNWGDLAYPGSGGRYQIQRHIYLAPFYYIDYGLALTCAMQFWLWAERDFAAARAAYVDLCCRGGEASFNELVRGAGLVVPFEAGCLEHIVARAESELDL